VILVGDRHGRIHPGIKAGHGGQSKPGDGYG
jgi:hypothetical protein